MLRRIFVTLAVAELLVAGILVGPSVADRLTYPRDDGFPAYYVTYMLRPGTPQDKEWAVDHPDDLLAEGDRACAWLSRRPSAPDVDPSGATSVDSLTEAYLDEVRTDSDLALTRQGHAELVYGAWEYLCESVRRDKSAPRSADEG